MQPVGREQGGDEAPLDVAGAREHDLQAAGPVRGGGGVVGDLGTAGIFAIVCAG